MNRPIELLPQNEKYFLADVYEMPVEQAIQFTEENDVCYLQEWFFKSYLNMFEIKRNAISCKTYLVNHYLCSSLPGRISIFFISLTVKNLFLLRIRNCPQFFNFKRN